MYLDQLKTKTKVQKWFKELIELYCIEESNKKKQITIYTYSYGSLKAQSSSKIIKVKNLCFDFEYFPKNEYSNEYIKISIISKYGTMVYNLYNYHNFESLKQLLKLHIKLVKNIQSIDKYEQRLNKEN